MLLKLSKFFTYASLFCVLVVLTNAFFPFIGGKTYWFRIAVELAVAFAMLWWAFEAPPGEARRRFRETFKKPLVVAVSIFVAVFLLAALFADNPHGAFWSNYERGEGGFQMLHYYAFFVLLSLFFTRWEDWRKLFIVGVAAAFLMVVYGIASAHFLGTTFYYIPDWLYRFLHALFPSTTPETFSIRFVSAYLGPGGQPVASTFLERLFWPSVRFQGSLGNPAYVAPYLIFTMFFCLYLAVREKRARWWWVAGTAFFGLFALLTQTRGAFLGFLAAVFAFLFYFIVHTEGRARLRARIALWGFVLVNWLLAFKALSFRILEGTLGRAALEDSSLWWFARRLYDVGLPQEILVYVCIASIVFFASVDFILTTRHATRRLVAAILLGVLLIGGSFYARERVAGSKEAQKVAESFSTRVWTWGSALQGFQERPLLGWGPENFPAVFDKYFNSKHYVPGENRETWFDRAHSVFFDYLAETGLIGLLAYLAIFIVFAVEFFRRTKPYAETLILSGLILAVVTGYLVQASVLFDVLPIYLNLFLVLAFAAWWLGQEEKGAATGHSHTH
jgi:hypothetical protein